MRMNGLKIQQRWVSWVLLSFLSLAAGIVQAAIEIEHWQQEQGPSIWLVSSMGIPMVDVQVEFDAGGRRDPEGKMGLASSTASLANKGVKAWQDRPAMDEAALGSAWADLGAEFSISADADTFTFALRSLTYEDVLPKAVALAAQQIAAPAFDETVAQRELERSIAALREARTRPGYVADTAFTPAVFGAHPYGHVTTEDSLQALKVADFHNFYQQFDACNAKVSLVGALTREQADQLVSELLMGLRKATANTCTEPVPVADPLPLTEAVLKNIPFDAAQAQVLIGQPAMKRSDPDFLKILVGNYILGGGGFVSRLTEEVREKRGLSYSVYSFFAARQSVGEFQIGLQTRPDQAEEAVAVVREVLRDFVDKGPTEAELKAAKDNLVGGFALRIDSNRKLLANVANIARNNLPLDYLNTWTEKVEAVSLEDIRRAFNDKLQPDNMVTVIVGAQGVESAAGDR